MNDSLAVDELNTPHHLREAAKKLFFSGLAIKALRPPPPPSLVTTFFGGNFF